MKKLAAKAKYDYLDKIPISNKSKRFKGKQKERKA